MSLAECGHDNVVDSIPRVSPSLADVCTWWAGQGIFQSLNELFHLFEVTDLTFFRRVGPLLGGVKLPRLKLPFAAHEGMISVVVCTLVTTGQLDTASPTVSRRDEVELVPVLGPGVSP